MKTLKKVPIEIVHVKFIPEEMEFGKLYYSDEYNVTNHLCHRGCGIQTPLPIKEGEWCFNGTFDKVTITPSVQHRFNCMSHYVIEHGFAKMLNEPRPKEDWNKSEFDTNGPNSCPQ